ncbi:MAG TPA: response regulator [Chryseolinea sp.]
MANIVIIDDDQDDSDLLLEAIRQVEPRTDCFVETNVSAVLKRLISKELPKPDVIFLDLLMPVVNGVQCLRELKQDPELRTVPVVIYTSSRSYAHRAETSKLGANYFVTKPPSFRQICKVVSEILAQEINEN